MDKYWLSDGYQNTIMDSLDRCRDFQVAEADIREAIPGIAMAFYDEALTEGDHIDAAKYAIKEVNRGLTNAATDIIETSRKSLLDLSKHLPSIEEMESGIKTGKYERVTEKPYSTPASKWPVDKQAASVGTRGLAHSKSLSSAMNFIGPDGKDVIETNTINHIAVVSVANQISEYVAEHPDSVPFRAILAAAMHTIDSTEVVEIGEARRALSKFIQAAKDAETCEKKVLNKIFSTTLSNESLAPSCVKGSGRIVISDIIDDYIYRGDRFADSGKPLSPFTRKATRPKNRCLLAGSPISEEAKRSDMVVRAIACQNKISDRIHELKSHKSTISKKFIIGLAEKYDSLSRDLKRWTQNFIPLSESEKLFNKRLALAIKKLSKEEQEEVYKMLSENRSCNVKAIIEKVKAEERKEKEGCDLCRDSTCVKVNIGALCSKHKIEYGK